MRQTTNTPKQLVPAYLDSTPANWRQDYVRNLRPVRGYPNWWRIVDNVTYIDGPPSEGAQYTRDLYVWKASVLQDAADNNTDTLELYNLVELLDSTERTLPNGDTEYRYKYSDIPPALTYQHTDVIDSVSLAFDQSGRRMVAFESAGDVFLIWYDTLVGQTVVTLVGAGANPCLVTTSYYRVGTASGSARILFYVDATGALVYRKQEDRFGVEYKLPETAGPVVELLKVSKNLYGGLTVLYVYEDGGTLATGSFTARESNSIHHVGTDKYPKSVGGFQEVEGEVSYFSLGKSSQKIFAKDSSAIAAPFAELSVFMLKDNRKFSETGDAAGVSASTANIDMFFLKSARIPVYMSELSDYTGLSAQSSSIGFMYLEETRRPVYTEAVPEAASVVPLGGYITNMILGNV